MDYKKEVKNFINYICEWVDTNHKALDHVGFSYEIDGNDRFAYVIFDKAIDKRIKKRLSKKYNIEAEVIYEHERWSCKQYTGGELIIRIEKEENIYCLGTNAF